MIVPVILAGGSGSRLWPLSRSLHPKQFLRLTDPRKSLLQLTVERAAALDDVAPPLLVCNEEHRFLVAEQMREQGTAPAAILLEPLPRNTAPAIALAALDCLNRDEDPVLLVLPADHDFRDGAGLVDAVEKARPSANAGRLVTFGVTPTRAETGYGYIRAGAGDGGVYGIDEFVEKPDQATAERYLAAGGYYWNSGIFVFRASAYVGELERHAPDILAACREAHVRVCSDADFRRIDREAFSACRAESIDYAVMERTDRAAMVALDAGWSDVGAWSALWETADGHDEDGNVAWGDVVLEDCRNSYVRGESRLVSAVDLDDMIVIETSDAVFVAPKERAQDVRAVVKRLEADRRPETRMHKRVYRPWGSYESLAHDGRFQVKRIVVKPGASLSLQMHHHRAEHWVVVKGTARVTRGDEQFLLSEDQSTYIPLGTRHRLENPGAIPLEVIEVQTGSYLGEDDIVRFADKYGR